MTRVCGGTTTIERLVIIRGWLVTEESGEKHTQQSRIRRVCILYPFCMIQYDHYYRGKVIDTTASFTFDGVVVVVE